MKSYYANQATSLLFSRHYRQRGSGFGALSTVIGRAAPPVAFRFILPTAKCFGKDLFNQSVDEYLDVLSKRRSTKRSVKNTLSRTVKNGQENQVKVIHLRKKRGSKPKNT